VLKIFTVYDSKTEAFIQPFYAQATGAAIRSFETAANKEGHDFQQHGGDYTLFELGQFDQATGKISTLEVPINLGLAITFTTRHDHTPPHLIQASE